MPRRRTTSGIDAATSGRDRRQRRRAGRGPVARRELSDKQIRGPAASRDRRTAGRGPGVQRRRPRRTRRMLEAEAAVLTDLLGDVWTWRKLMRVLLIDVATASAKVGATSGAAGQDRPDRGGTAGPRRRRGRPQAGGGRGGVALGRAPAAPDRRRLGRAATMPPAASAPSLTVGR